MRQEKGFESDEEVTNSFFESQQDGVEVEDNFEQSLTIVFCHRVYHQVQRKINLLYGGGSVGLMGLIAQTVFDGGSHVLGIIPKALIPHEISGETIGEVKTVADMHERKSEMAKHANAFIALPGQTEDGG